MNTMTSVAVAVILAGVPFLAHAQTPAVQEIPGDNPEKDLKPGPIRTAKKTGHVSNYDVAKVKPYTLPDPLRLANGQLGWVSRNRARCDFSIDSRAPSR